jgi:hypothetical protein
MNFKTGDRVKGYHNGRLTQAEELDRHERRVEILERAREDAARALGCDISEIDTVGEILAS